MSWENQLKGRDVALTFKDDVCDDIGTYLFQWLVTHLGPFSKLLAITQPQYQLPSWSKAQSLLVSGFCSYITLISFSYVS